MSETPPALIEWAGGPPAFRRLIDAFYDRVERDDLLSPLFPGGVSEEHRAHVTVWWVEVMGGAADYTAHHGGYASMLSHHLDLGITAEQRFRFASLMSLAADDAALPDDPEFRAAVPALTARRPLSGAVQLNRIPGRVAARTASGRTAWKLS